MSNKVTIKKIFIANRGEIARRIALTCRKIGVTPVTFNHSPNIPDYLRGLISEFIYEEKNTVATYLNPDLVIKAAKKALCDAIHPGFGFLSESAEFAARVEKEGLIWIGPAPETIKVMASKSEARNIAEKASVPCVPGIGGLTDAAHDIEKIERFAEKEGYPLLIKAALGGGGKGMRIVDSKDQLKEATTRAASEANNAFGDAELIVEKYLQESRHIEVQVLGDTAGNIAILGDRDCSIQRRHQKIIEESPAPHLNEQVREKLYEAAKNLSKAVNYHSAGTVEFIMDWSTPNKEQSFYFLEMNTRLQVEHTVTEEVFNTDLVEWQIRIAEGSRLPEKGFSQQPRHAIEARIYAEDPLNDFMPSPGFIPAFIPKRGPNIRWETGCDLIDNISPDFDPMVAKLVVSGNSRAEATRLIVSTLEQTTLGGIKSNVEFLGESIKQKDWASPTTKFIARNQKTINNISTAKRNENQEQAQYILNYMEQKSCRQSESIYLSTTQRAFSSLLQKSEPSIERKDDYTDPSDQEKSTEFGVGSFMEKGALKCFEWFIYSNKGNTVIGAKIEGLLFEKTTYFDKLNELAQPSESEQSLSAPVPGKIISIKGKEGDKVEKNQVIIILESMKMEFEVKATKTAIIDQVLVEEGDQVESDMPLLRFSSNDLE